jgi:signal transduction histidine kinase
MSSSVASPAGGVDVLSPAALVHLRRLAEVVAPRATALLRRFSRVLREGGYDQTRRKALSAITPGALLVLLAKRGAARGVMEHLEYHGRRLAKLNVPPSEVLETLRRFDVLLDPVLAGAFQPAREQLHLITVVAVNQAFYQVREAESQAFFGLAKAEMEARGLDDLLRRFVQVLARALRAQAGTLSLPSPGLPLSLRRPRFFRPGPATEQNILDPSLRGRCASYWSFPVGSVGVIQLGFRTDYPWLPRERELLSAAAERCCRVIERARLIEEAREHERQVRTLAAAARRAEDRERARIGRELHDETAQSMLFLRLQLEMLEKEAPEPMRARLGALRVLVEQNILDLRRLIAALSPAMLERLGLPAALRHLASRFEKAHRAGVRVRIDHPRGAVSREAAEVIYRVAQECLQNVARHSSASAVNLSLRSADNTLRLSVTDNGAGFDADAALSKPMSFGLAGMRERAALAGGELRVRSAPGQGATVTLQLPRCSAGMAGNGKDSSSVN